MAKHARTASKACINHPSVCPTSGLCSTCFEHPSSFKSSPLAQDFKIKAPTSPLRLLLQFLISPEGGIGVAPMRRNGHLWAAEMKMIHPPRWPAFQPPLPGQELLRPRWVRSAEVSFAAAAAFPTVTQSSSGVDVTPISFLCLFTAGPVSRVLRSLFGSATRVYSQPRLHSC